MPTIFLRCTRYNHHSMSALAALISRQVPFASGRLLKWERLAAPDGPLHCDEEGPLVILYSFMSPELEQVAAEVAQVKQARPDAILLAGGAHPSGDPHSTLGLGMHIAFVGEAELTLPPLLAQLMRQPSQQARIVHGQAPASLDPYPPWEIDLIGFSPLEITRGCPYGCRFCQTSYIFGRRMRHRSLATLEHCFRQMGARGRRFVRFISPNALGYQSRIPGQPNLTALESLLASARQAGLRDIFLGTFPAEVRPEYCTPAVLQLIKKYCRNKRIIIGAQTAVARLNRLHHRTHDSNTVRHACQHARAQGLQVYVDLLFGLPGERPDEAFATLQFAQELVQRFQARIHAHYFIPLPGTPLAHSRPSPLPPALIRELGNMQKAGVLDGDWDQQAALAARLPALVAQWQQRSPL